MIVVENYLYLPGCCYFCRSSNLPTIDTGIDLDHPNYPNSDNPSANTRFYICADCAIELGRMAMDSRGLELVTQGSKAELSGMVDSLAMSNMELTARVEDLENALRVVNSIKPTPSDIPANRNFKVVAQPGEVEV